MSILTVKQKRVDKFKSAYQFAKRHGKNSFFSFFGKNEIHGIIYFATILWKTFTLRSCIVRKSLINDG